MARGLQLPSGDTRPAAEAGPGYEAAKTCSSPISGMLAALGAGCEDDPVEPRSEPERDDRNVAIARVQVLQVQRRKRSCLVSDPPCRAGIAPQEGKS
jgi:hypothetical protein